MSQDFSIIIDHGTIAPVNGIDVVDGFNTIEKRFLLQLIFTLKFMCAKRYDSLMEIHSGTPTYDVSFSQEVQKHVSNIARKNGVIDQGKCKTLASKLTWIEREYHIQEYSDAAHKYLRCFVIQNNFHYCNFVVHTQNHIVPEA